MLLLRFLSSSIVLSIVVTVLDVGPGSPVALVHTDDLVLIDIPIDILIHALSHIEIFLAGIDVLVLIDVATNIFVSSEVPVLLIVLVSSYCSCFVILL